MLRFSKNKITENAPIAIAIGALSALITLGLTVIAASFIILSTENPSDHVSLGAFISMLFSAAVSGYLLSRIFGKRGMVTSVASHAAAVCVMLVIGIILGGVSPALLMNAFSYLGVGALLAFLGKPRAKKHHKALRR